MSVINFNTELSKRQLFQAGFLLAAFIGLIGALLYWRLELPKTAIAVWCVGGALVLVYFAVPAWRRAIYVGWLYAVFPIGWAVSHIILFLVFYGLFAPIGLIMRLFGRDSLRRTLDPEASTYWTDRPASSDADRYFHQY